jgi:hypothetical protein
MGFWGELARVVVRAPTIERWRRTRGPKEAIALARALGTRSRLRSGRARRVLQRAIRLVDRLIPGSEPNCFRRVLLEASMDRAAASEVMLLGLKRSAEPRSGHAWLTSEAHPRAGYDAVISI